MASPAPVLHVMVIGFHHKKGCQVEYSYPPLIETNSVDSNEVPPEWKHLPSLAIPDGAHNFMEDTVFFHLPARGDKPETVYGVSCYRQIDAMELRKKGSEVTRNTVSKSVCVLSRLPLYGLIQAKLELITHAYFDERDFSQVTLLEETYKNLNGSMNQNLLEGSQVFLGLSSRSMVQQFKHRLLVLFKLMLLERRVLFFGSPVTPICTTMLSVISLFPRMIEYGLQESASYSPSRQLSPTLKITRLDSNTDESNEYLEIHYTEKPTSTDIKHAEKEESTATVVELSKTRHRSHSDIPTSASKKDSNKKRVSPGHPVKVSQVKTIRRTVSADEKSGHDFPGIHRHPSRDSQDSVFSADTIDHPLSTRHRHSSLDSSNRKQISQNSPNSPQNKPKNEEKSFIERKVEQAATAIERITHLEMVQDDTKVDENILTGSPKNKSSKKDPLEFVHEITKVSSVQKHIQRLSSSGKSTSSIPDEDLTPDEKELLQDSDECAFSWQEDKLLLEINEDGESTDLSASNSSEKIKSTQEPAADVTDKTAVAHLSAPLSDDSCEQGTSHSHNMDLEGDIFSDPGTASGENKDQNSVEVGKSQQQNKPTKSMTLRDKLSARWSGNKENDKMNMELTEIRPVTPSNLNVDEFGFPLSVFTKGVLCHPYLSLQFYDLLQDINVRGLTIGATNILYKQKRHLLDAIVEVTGEGKIEIHDQELKKQLNLTTADLRFADYLVKSMVAEGDVYLDDTSWEGSEDWLRSEFRRYMLSLLAASTSTDEKIQEDFNTCFLDAWKTTHNYKLWHSTRHPGMVNVSPTHPFGGNVTMADVKLKLTHSLSGTEGGKKVNAAMASTGKVVLQTGKAVGGAITSARSAVSSWFSSWRQQSSDSLQPANLDITDDADNAAEGAEGSPNPHLAVSESPEDELFSQEGFCNKTKDSDEDGITENKDNSVNVTQDSIEKNNVPEENMNVLVGDKNNSVESTTVSPEITANVSTNGSQVSVDDNVVQSTPVVTENLGEKIERS